MVLSPPGSLEPPHALDLRGGRLDQRLLAYLAGSLVGFMGALALGRAELAAASAAFAVLAAIGVLDRRAPGVHSTITLSSFRVLEGDTVEGEIVLGWRGVASLDAILTPLPGVEPIEPSPVLGWSLPSGKGPVRLHFKVRATGWGRHQLGQLQVRVRRGWGLVTWDVIAGPGPVLRVLPESTRMDRLLPPTEPRTVAGAHLSRWRGQGTDFAEMRHYSPGDRLRDLNWAATARTGEPWVLVHHPERSGTVLLLVDSFFDGSSHSMEALTRGARSAWAVAYAHLRAQDRVGVLAVGSVPAWLSPTSGRRARWKVLDELLTVGGGAAARDQRQAQGHSRALVPPAALVVAITPLRSTEFVRNLVHQRRTGRTTVALVVDTADLLPPPRDPVERAAQAIWLAERDALRQELSHAGVPSAVIRDAYEVTGAVQRLRRTVSTHRQTMK
ncbi:MAG: DUF58 domain-containing protein [Acidimicrobiia bacterium]